MGCARKRDEAPRMPCPACGEVGRPVAAITVAAILHPRERPIADARLCRTRGCDVLYYGADGDVARKQEARVRVGLKEAEDPIPVCYCFGFSRADIERELFWTGDCTIPARITAEVKAGNCACETENPSGSCCLGEVTREIEEAKRRGAPEEQRGERQQSCGISLPAGALKDCRVPRRPDDPARCARLTELAGQPDSEASRTRPRSPESHDKTPPRRSQDY